MNALALTWMALILIFLAVEIATLGLTTIWFAAGALAAFGLSLLHLPLSFQLAAFFLTSFILLVLTRPIAAKYFNQERVKTNVDAMIGNEATVISEIDNHLDAGQVRMKGMEWTARSAEDSQVLLPQTRVRVIRVEGVKLIVEKKTQEDSSWESR